MLIFVQLRTHVHVITRVVASKSRMFRLKAKIVGNSWFTSNCSFIMCIYLYLLCIKTIQNHHFHALIFPILRIVCTVSFHYSCPWISSMYHGSGVVLDCIESWSLHPYLLFLFLVHINFSYWKINKIKRASWDSILPAICYESCAYSGGYWQTATYIRHFISNNLISSYIRRKLR